MLKTYRAMLAKDHLRWLGEKPLLGEETEVEIRIHHEADSLTDLERSQRALEALDKLAAQEHSSLTEIEDPVAWQRQQREEHVLPGRE